jgi:hypothetical protein
MVPCPDDHLGHLGSPGLRLALRQEQGLHGERQLSLGDGKDNQQQEELRYSSRTVAGRRAVLRFRLALLRHSFAVT